jgi:hypothetical protein
MGGSGGACCSPVASPHESNIAVSGTTVVANAIAPTSSSDSTSLCYGTGVVSRPNRVRERFRVAPTLALARRFSDVSSKQLLQQ